MSFPDAMVHVQRHHLGDNIRTLGFVKGKSREHDTLFD